MSTADDFTMQYAIQLPNGELFMHPFNGQVATWSEFDRAKHVYDQLAANAEVLGMTFAGEIVHRYCTRFISRTDQAEKLILELEDYLKQQGGQQR